MRQDHGRADRGAAGAVKKPGGKADREAAIGTAREASGGADCEAASAAGEPQRRRRRSGRRPQPPPPTPPTLPQEEEIVALPIPPREPPEPQESAEAVDEAAVAPPSDRGPRCFRLASQAMACGGEVSAGRCDDTGQGRAANSIASGRRAGRRRGGGPAAGVAWATPIFSTAPPWALAAVFLAVLQLVYAAWMIDVPGLGLRRGCRWSFVPSLATIYGMLMTLTMITPVNHPLILGLDEVRRLRRPGAG